MTNTIRRIYKNRQEFYNFVNLNVYFVGLINEKQNEENVIPGDGHCCICILF